MKILLITAFSHIGNVGDQMVVELLVKLFTNG